MEELKKQIDLNFTGAVTTVQAALKYMTNGDRVVFVSSACALFAFAALAIQPCKLSAYSARTTRYYDQLCRHYLPLAAIKRLSAEFRSKWSD